MKINKIILIGIFIIFFNFASAYVVSNSQFNQPGLTTSFLNSGPTQTVTFNSQMCQEGQDFILQIAPGGCTPTVVRSDLLEEQNVPVFCPIQMMKINPAVNIKSIDSIDFGTSYPRDVSSINFLASYPALGLDRQLSNLNWNNIGYAVINLRQNKNESSMPDYVTGNLTARVRYNAYDAFGSADRTLYLPLLTDQQFNAFQGQYAFFNNMGYLRADSIPDAKSATISLYSGVNANFGSTNNVQKQKILSYNLNVGQTSPNFFLPGFGCFASSTFQLNAVGGADTRALISVNTEEFQLKKGETFLDGRCQITDDPIKTGLRESVPISCQADDGGKSFTLRIEPTVKLNVGGTIKSYAVGDFIGMNSDGDKRIYLGYVGTIPGKTESLENSVIFLVTVPGSSAEKLDTDTLDKVGRFADDKLRTDKSVSDIATSLFGNLATTWNWLLAGNNFDDVKFGEVKNFKGVNFQIVSFGTGANLAFNNATLTSYYGNAVNEYTKIKENYANEVYPTGDPSLLGEKALAQLVNLSSLLSQNEDLKKYCDDFKAKYPNSKLDVSPCDGIPKYFNAGVSTQTFLIGGDYKEISFNGINMPSFESYGIEITIKKGSQTVTEKMSKGDVLYLDSLFSPSTDTSQILSMDNAIDGNGKVYFKYDSNQKKWKWSIDQKVWIDSSVTTVSGSTISSLNGKSPTAAVQQLIASLNGVDFPTGRGMILGSQGNSAKQEYIKLNEITDEKHASLDFILQNRSAIAATGDFLSSPATLLTLNNPYNKDGTSYAFTINKINLDKVAQVSVHTQIRDTSNVNFKFTVGIEKRAIQLSPDQIRSQIKTFTDITNKLNSISNSLGKLVDTMQTACQSVGAILTLKNLIFNSGTESLARTKVMSGTSGWNAKCQSLNVNGKVYSTQEQCLLDNSDAIENEVTQVTDAMNVQNARIKEIEGMSGVTTSGGLFGNNIVNQSEEIKYFSTDVQNGINSLPSQCRDESVDMTKVKSALDVNGFGTFYDLNTAQQIQLYSTLCAQNPTNADYKSQLTTLLTSVQKNAENKVETTTWATSMGIDSNKIVVLATKDAKSLPYQGLKLSDTKISISGIDSSTPVSTIQSSLGGKYVIPLDNTAGTLTYTIKTDDKGQQMIFDGSGNRITDKTVLSQFSNIYFTKPDTSTATEIKNPQLSYYETAPYQGLPAVVPIQPKNGWYVYITQPTSTLSATATTPSTGGYDASGRVNSFYLCNAGSNGVMEYNPMNDYCQFIILGNSNSYANINGLTTDQASKLVSDSVSAIEAASKARINNPSVKTVNILGEKYNVGTPAVDTPSVKCTDVMSPTDCKILFNACDPVICPSSRCDFGGKFPVKNVVQSGVIGSIALCLPNYVGFGGTDYIPVCLTGVKAGIDNWASVTNSYVSCLNTSLNTGQTVGICDEIYSIYGCQLFWQELTPFVNFAIPTVDSLINGGATKGGGELVGGIQGALKNAENSVNYITQFYAVGAFDAFKARSQGEIGTTVCKSAISQVFPTGQGMLDALGQSQSPPQFTGSIQAIPFSSVTNPPQAQYKVYYHIYAGNDAAANYQVYLKSGSSSYYNDAGLPRMVDTGYIPVGQTEDNTKDFTDVQGYTQLCIQVNNQEECGFGGVTTNFASNYLTQQYLKDQATATSITTSDECISGDSNLLSLLNLNVQAGLTNTLSPNIQASGITRVCASQNPGIKSDPNYPGQNQRWVQVGTCGNPNLGCWIDKQSIAGAMNTQWVTYNQTLSSLGATLAQAIQSMNGLMTDDQFEANRSLIENTADPQQRIKMIEAIYDKVYGNNKKAYLLLLAGQSYGELAVNLFNKLVGEGKIKTGETSKVVDDEAQFKNYVSNIYNYIEAPTSGSQYNYCYQFKQGTWYRAQKSGNACGTFTVADGSVVNGKGFIDGITILVNRVKTDPSHTSLAAGSFVLGGENFDFDSTKDLTVNLSFDLQGAWNINFNDGNNFIKINDTDKRFKAMTVNGIDYGKILLNLTDKNLYQGAIVLFEGKGFSFSSKTSPMQNPGATTLTPDETTQLDLVTPLVLETPFSTQPSFTGGGIPNDQYKYSFSYTQSNGWYVKYTYNTVTNLYPIPYTSPWININNFAVGSEVGLSNVNPILSSLKNKDLPSGISQIVKNSEGELNKKDGTFSSLDYGNISFNVDEIKVINQPEVGEIHFKYNYNGNGRWMYGYDGNAWYEVTDIRQKQGTGFLGTGLFSKTYTLTQTETNLILSLKDKPRLDGEIAIFLYGQSKQVPAVTTTTLDLTNCKQYYDLINTAGIKYNVDPNLILAVMYQESFYNKIRCNPQAYSGSSYGLMQINPTYWCGQYGLSSDQTQCKKDLFDPAKNINAGVQIILKLYNQYKDTGLTFNGCNVKNVKYTGWDAALRAYNGLGCNSNFPAQDYYVENVTKIWNQLKTTNPFGTNVVSNDKATGNVITTMGDSILNTAQTFLGSDAFRVDANGFYNTNVCATFVSDVLVKANALPEFNLCYPPATPALQRVANLNNKVLPSNSFKEVYNWNKDVFYYQKNSNGFNVTKNLLPGDVVLWGCAGAGCNSNEFQHATIFEKYFSNNGGGYVVIGDPGSSGPVQEQVESQTNYKNWYITHVWRSTMTYPPKQNQVASTNVNQLTQYQTAISQAEKLTGKYSDNKDFIDNLYYYNLIDSSQYSEIKGGAWYDIFNSQKDMSYVFVVLTENKVSKFGSAQDLSDKFFAIDSAVKNIDNKSYGSDKANLIYLQSLFESGVINQSEFESFAQVNNILGSGIKMNIEEKFNQIFGESYTPSITFPNNFNTAGSDATSVSASKIPTQNDYFTALYSSTPDYKNALGMVKLNNSFINLQWNGKGPILDYAIQNNDFNGVQYLVSNGADVNIKSSLGETPIHFAARYSNVQIIDYLLNNNANIESKNNFGETPIFYAAGYNTVDVVKEFVNKNAKINIVDNLGYNVLGYANKRASSSDKTAVMNYLSSLGLN